MKTWIQTIIWWRVLAVYGPPTARSLWPRCPPLEFSVSREPGTSPMAMVWENIEKLKTLSLGWSEVVYSCSAPLGVKPELLELSSVIMLIMCLSLTFFFCPRSDKKHQHKDHSLESTLKPTKKHLKVFSCYSLLTLLHAFSTRSLD